MLRRTLLAVVLFTLSVSGAFAAEPTELGKGKIADASLEKLAPKSGFITDAKTFAKLWKAWRPAEAVPEIDFRQDLVIVGLANGPNLVMFQPKLQENGDLTFVVASTRMGGPGFGYRLVKVSREGIERVNGTPIAAGLVNGTITIPGSTSMEDGQTIEIKFFEFDPRLADASADLIDEAVLTNIQHETGKTTEIPFAVGKDYEVKKDRRYYITVFVLQDKTRTHIGEIDGKRGLNKVLENGDRAPIDVILREVNK
ncbi:hypothetical protein AB1K70_04945 [Bremerella sp. JC770]|uniref:hypothetical protein n=1 Tax=Bremerella sp. JC770 TaxID=3232137 RepID=UPI00345AB7B9